MNTYATQPIVQLVTNHMNWIREPGNDIVERLKTHSPVSEWAELTIRTHRAAGHTYAAMQLVQKYRVMYIAPTLAMLSYVERQCAGQPRFPHWAKGRGCANLELHAASVMLDNPRWEDQLRGRQGAFDLVIFDPWSHCKRLAYHDYKVAELKRLAHLAGQLVVFLG